METRGQFRLHLPGLLKVLAEHLYSTQRVGVRELLQNGHDSCVRRAVEWPRAEYRPRIDLTTDPPSRTLRVSDNGSGLTEDEIHSYLTVIGRGYTRELRNRLATEDPSLSRELIGQFGIGFLSAFLLASEVVVETKSASGPAIRWSSTGDEQFAMEPGDRSETGTTVELRLKPSAVFLLHEPNLLKVVRDYADFLPTPIHVNGSPAEANLGTPPWDEADAEAACRRYIRRRFGEADPLWVLPLSDGVIDLGHDTFTVPLRGFLFVPPESVASIREYGDVAVYIRGMAICDENKNLLPDWARFLRGVIDCPALQPTASREAVHQDDSFESVRQTLAAQLAQGIGNLADRDPATWRRIVHGHSDVIMGWASKDPRFFRMVAESVPLRTTRGRLSMPEYLQATGKVVYYTTRELGSLQEKVLAEGRELPAIDASWFSVVPFLQSYVSLHPGLSLILLDDNLETLLSPAPVGDLADLVRLCEELGFKVEVASFKPVDLPAVMTYPANAETIRDASTAIDEGLLPDGFSGLAQGYVAQQRAVSNDVGTLHLNATCPLIRRLAAPDLSPARRQAAIAVVVYFARLFCGRMLDARQASADIRAWQRSLEGLLAPMSDSSDDFNDLIGRAHQNQDQERIALANYYDQGFACQEQDPERSFTLFTKGRDESARLQEPSGVRFFEKWRLTAITSYVMDFSRALPIAIDLMVRYGPESGPASPGRESILINVLYTYLNIDPIGYCDEIERGLAYLDTQVSSSPSQERFVLHHRWMSYLQASERWEEAYDLSIRALAQVEESSRPETRVWHGSWTLAILCRVCDQLGKTDELEGHAEYLMQLASKNHLLGRAEAQAACWRAVVQTSRGEENTASKSFHRGLAILEQIQRRDTACADPMARYYELRRDWKAALGVRDRELAVVSKHGMLHLACQIQFERCRLLEQAGELTPADLDAARQSMSQLRNPGFFQERLDRFQA